MLAGMHAETWTAASPPACGPDSRHRSAALCGAVESQLAVRWQAARRNFSCQRFGRGEGKPPAAAKTAEISVPAAGWRPCRRGMQSRHFRARRLFPETACPGSLAESFCGAKRPAAADSTITQHRRFAP